MPSTMNMKTPVTIAISSLLAAIALAVLGLAADSASYFHAHQGKAVDVHYTRWNSTAEAQYSYWLRMGYAPSQMSLGKENAEIATGAVCAVFGLILAIGAVFARRQQTSSLVSKIMFLGNKQD
jgi:hypothetical protein